jgi:hypothetical protein
MPFLVTDNVKKIMDELKTAVVVFAVNRSFTMVTSCFKQKRTVSSHEKFRHELQVTVCVMPLKGDDGLC